MTPLRALLFAALFAWPLARADGPTPPAVALGVLEQETLPGLVAREGAAKAQATAALRYFAGEGALAGAWPNFDGLPLGDSTVLDGIRDNITARASARARDRVAPLLDGLTDKDRARLQAAKTSALDAEDAADALTTRLLVGLRTGLARAPGLRDAEFIARMAELRGARVAATAGLTADDDGWPGATHTAAQLAASEAALVRLREAAWRALTVPGDITFVTLSRADQQRLLELLEGTEGASPVADPLSAQAQVVDRLQRALPLLPDADRAAADLLIRRAESEHFHQEIADLKDDLRGLEAALQGVSTESSTEPLEHFQATATQATSALTTWCS